MKYGEIWTVVFTGSVGHEFAKDRPALIIESDNQLKIDNVITIMPLTSKNKNFCDDIIIAKSDLNNLYCDSVLKVHHIQSFDRSRFIRKIGVVENEVMDKIKQYLKKHFGII